MGTKKLAGAKQTAAEKIAKRLGDDGTNFTDREGRDLDEIARDAGAKGERYPTWERDLYRYTFPDGSAIVIAGAAAWDIEGTEPWSRSGEVE